MSPPDERPLADADVESCIAEINRAEKPWQTRRQIQPFRDLKALIRRASDPRVGDRFIGLDQVTMIEVRGIFPRPREDSPVGMLAIIMFTNTLTGAVLHSHPLWEYVDLVKTTLEGGHTFHAVEDDEE